MKLPLTMSPEYSSRKKKGALDGEEGRTVSDAELAIDMVEAREGDCGSGGTEGASVEPERLPVGVVGDGDDPLALALRALAGLLHAPIFNRIQPCKQALRAIRLLRRKA